MKNKFFYLFCLKKDVTDKKYLWLFFFYLFMALFVYILR